MKKNLLCENIPQTTSNHKIKKRKTRKPNNGKIKLKNQISSRSGGKSKIQKQSKSFKLSNQTENSICTTSSMEIENLIKTEKSIKNENTVDENENTDDENENTDNEGEEEQTNNFQNIEEDIDWSKISSGPESTYYKYNVIYHVLCNLTTKQKRVYNKIVRSLNSGEDGGIFFPHLGITVGEFSVMGIYAVNQK